MDISLQCNAVCYLAISLVFYLTKHFQWGVTDIKCFSQQLVATKPDLKGK